MENEYGTGAHESPRDIRTFAYMPSGVVGKVGLRYNPEDIEHQHKVGICTAISHVQQAQKVHGRKFSPEFQYLLQKKYLDGNWDEGSSIINSIKVGNTYGFLPAEEWTYTHESDRLRPYSVYAAMLQAIPDSEIQRLISLAAPFKTQGYEKVPVDILSMSQAISESEAGILTRVVLDSQWWTPPIEPLRAPITPISGHAVIDSNGDNGSFRKANTWGKDWADNGTAYYLFKDYQPTEAWLVHYLAAPDHVQKQLDQRTQLQGKLLNTLQLLVVALQKLKLMK